MATCLVAALLPATWVSVACVWGGLLVVAAYAIFDHPRRSEVHHE